jgi:hypothetical protein
MPEAVEQEVLLTQLGQVVKVVVGKVQHLQLHLQIPMERLIVVVEEDLLEIILQEVVMGVQE